MALRNIGDSLYSRVGERREEPDFEVVGASHSKDDDNATKA